MTTDETMNSAIRTAADRRRRFTVDEAPTDEGALAMNQLIRRQPEQEPEPETAETAAAFPDLGQGARPLPASPGPSMTDFIRGSLIAKRAWLDREVTIEHRLRQSEERGR